MRRLKLTGVLFLALIVLACATFDRNAYRTLAASKTTYETAMGTLGDLYIKGKITEAQKTDIIKVAGYYYMAYLSAQRAYDVYHNNKSVANQEQLQKLLNDIAVKLGEVTALLAKYQGGA